MSQLSVTNSTEEGEVTKTLPNGHQRDEDRQRNIYIYSSSIVLVLALTLTRSFSFFTMCLRASRTLHDKLFRGIIRAKMVFFNNNPSGRILNRFSTDIGCIDSHLPVAMMDCLVVSAI